MGRPSKEFQAFTSAIDKLLSVPRETIQQRLSEHKEKAALNPRKRGPKPKITPLSSDNPGEESGNG